MKKLFVKVFLPLLILLFSGYANVHASACGADTLFATIRAQEELQHKDFRVLKEAAEPSVVLPTISLLGQQNDNIISTDENEENEFSSSKKFVDIDTYFAVASSPQIPDYLHHYHKKRFEEFRRISHVTSRRWYLLFRVFRI